MDLASQFDFQLSWRSVTRALPGGLFDGRDHWCRSMAQDHRTPGEHVVNVGISVKVVETGASGSFDEPGLASDGAESANRAVDSSWNELLSLGEELDRS